MLLYTLGVMQNKTFSRNYTKHYLILLLNRYGSIAFSRVGLARARDKTELSFSSSQILRKV
jgi:hypothetical protein